ncbi:MAG: ABC transporter permease [Bdellovibrionales bacterium]|nr:ABC transporter permease [Bdellovibrionales bacterium]
MNAVKFFFRQTFVIAWRDFSQTIFSPLFLSLIGIFCGFLSYTFPRELFRFADSYVMPAFQQMGGQEKNIHFAVFVSHISLINLLLLFCVPALTMKFLAEERKNRTFDLLMTTPISSFHIVTGKYLALLGLVFCFLAVTFLYPLMVAVFPSEIPFKPLLASYIGLFLLAALYTAVGLFASSLTSSVFLSMIIGFILNVVLWFISQGQDFSNNPIFTSIMEYLSLGNHLTFFIKGSLTVSSCVFFISAIFLFLFLVYRVIEFGRWRP